MAAHVDVVPAYGADVGGDHGFGPVRWRWVRRLFGSTVALAFTVVGGSLGAGQLLIQPASHPVGQPPADLVGARAVTVPVAGRPGARGWLIPGAPGHGGVLLLHGLQSDRRAMLPRARYLRGLGFTTLLIDLQAHGESPGRHITFGLLESEDVQAAVGFLQAQVPGQPVGVIGVSLGAAATVLARPPVPVRAVVLESMYATFDTAVDNRMRRHLGPPGPLLSELLVTQLPLRLGITGDDLRPVDRIGGLHLPVLICSGDQDRHATLAETRALFAAASEPKSLWIVPGAAHVDLYAHDPAGYRARVGAFLQRNLAPRAPGH